MAAHLFMLYFGMMSMMTPPVALRRLCRRQRSPGPIR